MHRRVSVFVTCLLTLLVLAGLTPVGPTFVTPADSEVHYCVPLEAHDRSSSEVIRREFTAWGSSGSGAIAKEFVAHGTSAMVACADSIASAVGLEILESGGNAVDAAVAVAFSLAVTFPNAGNIGGGGFMLIKMRSGEPVFIDYREKAPMKASREMYLDEHGNVVEDLSTKGHLASGVPGTVAGLALAHKLYGKLGWSELLAPAHKLARNGFPITHSLVGRIRAKKKLLGSFEASREKFIKGELKTGDIFVQPHLAKTLKRIMEGGEKDFYRGETAELIAKEMKTHEGLITSQDLAEYEAVIREPVRFSYRSLEVLSAPLPSSGGMILYLLSKILETESIRSYGFHSTEAVHLISEAEKIAFRLRALYMGDEDFYSVPKNALLSPACIEGLRKLIDPSRVIPIRELEAGKLLPESINNLRSNPGGGEGVEGSGGWEGQFMKPIGSLESGSSGESEETTHFSIVDEFGNTVANSYTLNSSFGSGVTVAGAGFLLNNEMDDFSIKPGFPNIYGLIGGEANAIDPGKRMLSSMSPTIITKGGKLFMTLGTPGGSTIPTTVFQVMMNVIDFGMSIEEAVAAPRFHEQYLPDGIYVEKGTLSGDVEEQLREMGHRIILRAPIGDVQVIMVEDGRLIGVSDPRGWGRPMGY